MSLIRCERLPNVRPLKLGLALMLALVGAVLGLSSIAQENHPPGIPGEITISEITAHSARISWGAATDADGDSLAYLVSLRKRLEGMAQPWSVPHDTRGTSMVWDGLSAATVYEVKVTASDGKTTGLPRIRELAFTTLRDAEGNHPPTTPRGIEAAEVGAHSARLVWGAVTDTDGDAISYSVSVRKRLEGAVSEWKPARTTALTYLVWGELEAETVYDARVRASDGKSFSPWFLKENAFRTPPAPTAPTKPGEITVGEVGSTSARVSWGAAGGPAGVTLAYEVQVRARLERVPQPWRHAGETTGLFVLVTSLSPETSYDVQVRAWARGVAGAWAVKERAFATLSAAGINHPPSRPGPLEISDVTPFCARLAWGESSDADGDALKYAVCLRTRVEGVAQAWSPARETERTAMLWDGLSPRTVYEVRVRAWDGKVYSDWYLKEHAFETPAPSRLAGFVSRPDPAHPEGSPVLLLVWPTDVNPQILESTESLGAWMPCAEIESDGAQNRAQFPMDTSARFFRIR